MKPFTMYILSALTLLATKAALASAPVCDLQVIPEVIERRNETVVHTIRGDRDNLHSVGKKFGTVLGAILLAPAMPFALPYFNAGEHGATQNNRDGIVERMSHIRRGGRNSDAWYTEQTQAVILECNQYIRENFADDVISVTGPLVVSRHYHCSEPYERVNSRHRNRVNVDVVYSDPVYAEMTVEQALTLKCQKLTQCIIQSGNASELEQLQQTQIQLGCQ